MVSMILSGSPIETISFRGRTFYIKRDDLLHATFSGNKARKFLYYLENDFSKSKRLISYGSPQANSFYSLSSLAKLKKWKFDFYVDHIASFVKDHPAGNYREALNNSANIIEVGDSLQGRDIETYLHSEILPFVDDALFVPEGGRCQQAAYGVESLAKEIVDWFHKDGMKELKVALPSGTGTTALYLQRAFMKQKEPIEVLTCACVGGDEYLKKQFFELESDCSFHPRILASTRKYHFGKLYDEFYEVWHELRTEVGIEFELLYDPLGWINLMSYMDSLGAESKVSVMYIHQGGILGNESMLPRYERRIRNKLR